MATYAENAADRERATRKKAQDAHIDKVTKACDADVAANTDKRGGWKRMKYERASFTVVTSSQAYREGYDGIDWTSAAEPEQGEDGAGRVPAEPARAEAEPATAG